LFKELGKEVSFNKSTSKRFYDGKGVGITELKIWSKKEHMEPIRQLKYLE
jgi:hypothetical protein